MTFIKILRYNCIVGLIGSIYWGWHDSNYRKPFSIIEVVEAWLLFTGAVATLLVIISFFIPKDEWKE